MTRVVEHRIATMIEERRAACRDWRRCRDSLDDPFFGTRMNTTPTSSTASIPGRERQTTSRWPSTRAAIASLPTELRELGTAAGFQHPSRLKANRYSRDTLYARLKRLQAALLAAGI